VAAVVTQSEEAPGDLAVVRAFVNTLEIDTGVDELATPEELVAWLAARELVAKGASARPGDVRRARLYREALRELLLSNNEGGPVPRDAARTLDDVAARARLRLRMDDFGLARLEAEGKDVDAAFGRLLIIVYRAMENDTWARLKACRNDACLWVFYDHSKNRSRHWCSMEACGARHKAQQYRARHKAT
jgi:predicted RNA-binding Zn ribbon-like protein